MKPIARPSSIRNGPKRAEHLLLATCHSGNRSLGTGTPSSHFGKRPTMKACSNSALFRGGCRDSPVDGTCCSTLHRLEPSRAKPAFITLFLGDHQGLWRFSTWCAGIKPPMQRFVTAWRLSLGLPEREVARRWFARPFRIGLASGS